METKSKGVMMIVWKTPPTRLARKEMVTGEPFNESHWFRISLVIAKVVNWDEDPATALNIVAFAPLHKPLIFEKNNSSIDHIVTNG